MLQTKSFKITEGEAISAHLKKYHLSGGGNLIVSEGNVLVPFEDGEPMNNDQILCRLSDEKNEMGQKIRLITHSNRVLEIQNDADKKALEEAKGSSEGEESLAPSKAAYESRQTAKAEVARLKNTIAQTESSLHGNKVELVRLERNIQVYDEQIALLKK